MEVQFHATILRSNSFEHLFEQVPCYARLPRPSIASGLTF